MAAPTPLGPSVAPVLSREPVVVRDTLLMTVAWLRWLDTFKTDTQQRLAALEQRVFDLENP